MPYTLIKGEFHIHYPDIPRMGPEPDGDTLKFKPDHRQLIENLPRANWLPKFTQKGITTIRFEGIDALETHFMVEGKEFHQHMGLAVAARDTLLAEAGFGKIQFFSDSQYKVQSVENHPIRGYVLSNGLDTYGRTIAFVYTGEHPQVDGSSIYLEPQMLDNSLNAIMLKQGMAYAAFYLSLPVELRNHLKAIVSIAREAKTGLWAKAEATTAKKARITGPENLQKLVIWPKLFRRLAAFFQDGQTNPAVLDSWLRADPRDRDDRILLPTMELGNMHDLIAINGDYLQLNYLPEDIVIVPDDFKLPVTPEEPAAAQHAGIGSVRIVGALINPTEKHELEHETVTILNTTNTNINLKNWFIADRNGKQPLNDVLNSGETSRIRLDSKVRLSNKRDTITILDPDGQIIDQVTYEPGNLPDEGFTKVF